MTSLSKSYRGLQRLKFYCQMCQKQCRDANGFKCHCMTESHNRMMRLVLDNPNKIIGEYSKEFEKGYVDILARKYRNKIVDSNKVYGQYISDKSHTHMNATKWTTLTGFIHHLKDKEIVNLHKTDKGFDIEYIDNSPEALARKRDNEKKTKLKVREKKREDKQFQNLLKLHAQAPQEKEEEKEIKKYKKGKEAISFKLSGQLREKPDSTIKNIFESELEKKLKKTSKSDSDSEEKSSLIKADKKESESLQTRRGVDKKEGENALEEDFEAFIKMKEENVKKKDAPVNSLTFLDRCLTNHHINKTKIQQNKLKKLNQSYINRNKK